MNNFSFDFAGLYINWANTSLFIIPHVEGEAIKLIPYYMIGNIYKTVKLSHLKKLQIIQNVKNLMFQIIFIFSDWILIKQIIVFSNPFCCWGKQIFESMLPGGMSNFLLPRAWRQELRPGGGGGGCDFEWGGALVKMPRCLESMHFLGIWAP